MRRRLALLMLALATALPTRWYLRGPSAEARDGPAPLVFYGLPPDRPVEWTLGAAPQLLKLAVRWSGPLQRERRPIEVVFRSRDGGELAREVVELAALGPTQVFAGVEWSRPRWVRLTPPEGASRLEVLTHGHGAVVRLTQGTQDTRRHALDYSRIGIDSSLLTGDEEKRLRALKWAPLPALSDAETVVLPLPDAGGAEPVVAVAAASAPSTRHVDATHAAAFNVLGPGSVTLHATGSGQLVIRVIGSAPEQTLDMSVPSQVSIQLPSGTSSILVQGALEADADITMALKDASALELPDGNLSKRSAIRFVRGVLERYRLDGVAPIRIWAAAVGPAKATKLSWRLLREERELARGEMTLPSGADPFSWVVDGPGQLAVGEALVRTLVPEGADLLECSTSGDVVAGVDMQLTQGADPAPREPFPGAPRGFRWLGVPSRAPSWVPLKSQANAKSGLHVELVRVPRLVGSTQVDRAERSFVSLAARGARAVEVMEASHAPRARQKAVLQLVDADAVSIHSEPREIHRKAYELTPGQSIRLPIQTHGEGARPIYMAVYYADGPSGRLTTVLDQGMPRRQRGVSERLSLAQQTRKLADGGGEARLASVGHVRRSLATVLLGDDLAPGQHVLEVTYEGTTRAWARFWTPGRRVRRERISLWVSEEPVE